MKNCVKLRGEWGAFGVERRVCSGLHWIATRARSWWNQTGPNAIHPVSRYCDVIVKDLTLICVILTKLVNCKRVDGSGRIAVFIGRFLWGWP